MNEMINDWTDAVSDSFNEMWTQTAEFVPALMGAIALMIVGFFVAKLARYGTVKLATLARVDRAADRGRISETLEGAGMNHPVSEVLGTLAYWLAILGFALSAARTLGWEVLADSISSLFAWLPNVIAAVVVLAVFMAGARIVRDLVTAGLAQFSVGNARQLGNISEVLVTLFGALVAVDQLGFDTTLLTTNVTIIMAGVVGAAALAFGLGARGVIANIIGGYYVRQMMSTGDALTVGDMSGTIRSIGRTAVAIDTDGGVRYVPHSSIIEDGASSGGVAA